MTDQCALRDIAEIHQGYSFREGVRHDPAGAVAVIQMRDLGDDGLVSLCGLDRVEMQLAERQRVIPGDILFRARGGSATSAIVAEDPGTAVAAAPLLRIRLSGDSVVPAYLSWYINQPPAQAHFQRNAEGSNVKMISRRALEALQIEIPGIERQHAVVELADLARREHALVRSIDGRRQQLLSEIMLRHVKGVGA